MHKPINLNKMKKLSFPEFSDFRLNPTEMKRISGGRYGVRTQDDDTIIACLDSQDEASELADDIGGKTCSNCC